MIIEEQVSINGSAAAVWDVITDFENGAATVSGIEKVEILEKPESGLIGLKWRETRIMWGKTASEDMWIVEAEAEALYRARAESHGCIYFSKMSISAKEDGCVLTMSHQTKPDALIAKILAPIMGLAFKRSLRKILVQDLSDIKGEVEKRGGMQS